MFPCRQITLRPDLSCVEESTGFIHSLRAEASPPNSHTASCPTPSPKPLRTLPKRLLQPLPPPLPHTLTAPPQLILRRPLPLPLPNPPLPLRFPHDLCPHAEPPLPPQIAAAAQAAVAVDVVELPAHGRAVVRLVEAAAAGHGGRVEGGGVVGWGALRGRGLGFGGGGAGGGGVDLGEEGFEVFVGEFVAGGGSGGGFCHRVCLVGGCLGEGWRLRDFGVYGGARVVRGIGLWL